MMDQSDFELWEERLLSSEPLQASTLIKEANSSVWIASGLAKISAIYGTSIIQSLSCKPSRFSTPIEYVQNNQIQCLPILVSLRGNHSDAIEVAEIIASRPERSCLLITGDENGAASNILRNSSFNANITCSNLPSRDQRFVNCKSVIMLSALVQKLVNSSFGSIANHSISRHALIESWSQVKTSSGIFLEQISNIQDWEQKQIIILSDGITSPCAVTWQSILSESGVATPVYLDIKDYTHGDHIAATRTRNVIYIVISHPGIKEITQIFTDRFSSLFPVLKLELKSDIYLRFWENLFVVINVTSGLTSLLGYSNQRPPKDPTVWSWRNWGKVIK
ncbi:MAG: hypothetical protein ABSB19_09510 [Methylomonas sp.]|jgi:hypothetical protein